MTPGQHFKGGDKFDRSVSLLTWGYNEEESVEGFLDRAFSLMERTVEEYEIIFIDDGSTDRTGEIVDRYAIDNPLLKVFHNDRNRNVGFSSRRAIREAKKEFLFWQTVDWSYDLENLRRFLELLKHFDVVQGIRPTPERLLSHIPLIRSVYRVKGRSDNFWKAIVSLSNYYVLRILFGIHFHDFQNITFYPTELVQSLDLRGDSSFCNPELLIKTHVGGATFIEVPIPFIPRQEGEAKGTRLKSVIRSVWDILANWFAWGWQLRLKYRGKEERRIFRVAEPFFLDDQVLELVLPLLKKYR